MSFVRPKPIPFIMTILAVGLMSGLGIWQLERLAWKEELISKLEKAVTQEPMDGLPNDIREWRSHRFKSATISGRFLPIAEFHIAARYHKSQLGYHVFNPFEMDDGRIVLINRGWVPTDLKEKTKRPFLNTKPQTIKVQIRTSNDRNYFTPENQPEKNVWFGRDLGQMRGYSGILMEPYSVDLIAETEDGVYPIAYGGQIKIRNDHLGYAITWFGIALGALVVSLAYHRKKPDA